MAEEETNPVSAPPAPAVEHRTHCEHCEAHTAKIGELESQIAALAPTPVTETDTNPDSAPVGVPWTHRKI